MLLIWAPKTEPVVRYLSVLSQINFVGIYTSMGFLKRVLKLTFTPSKRRIMNFLDVYPFPLLKVLGVSHYFSYPH